MAESARAVPRHVAALTCLLALAFTGCGEANQMDTARGDTVLAAPVVAPRKAAKPGLIFDPSALRPGTAVGELVADSVDAQPSPIDSTYVGVARFRGQIELSGWTIPHYDSDMRDVASCFEADSASATRLPRWLGDERRSWLCFVNPVDATRSLGPSSDGVSATIVIEDFTIHRGHSDQVNSARFLRRLTRCYRSPRSVLFGPPTRSGQQGKGPGWLRLEGAAFADSGLGELVDADRKWLGASWRRLPNDSVSVVAMDHNGRVELRLVVSDGVATGSARAHSDAAAERDEAGRLRDFRRAWVLHAVRASCDSMPVRWR